MAATFRSVYPATGQHSSQEFVIAQELDVDQACERAARAARQYAATPGKQRAEFLSAIAGEIAAISEKIVQAASEETGLGVSPRLTSELDRTVFTLRMFADLIKDTSWKRNITMDAQEGSRPGFASTVVPLGPVAVFGASNFPLAYSTAGGDTASALAAGCPVVVKGHALHPETGLLVARAVDLAAEKTGMPTGVFSYIVSGGELDHAVGARLVQHPAIAAVGFTGSFAGGMALTRLAAARSIPIPVFAEMGSCNPIFILTSCEKPDETGGAIAASMLNSNGQMCTSPGLIFVVSNEEGNSAGDRAVLAMAGAIYSSSAQTMLSESIRSAYRKRVYECKQCDGVEVIARGSVSDGAGTYEHAVLLRCDLATFKRNITLREECFGPCAIVVACKDEKEMLDIAGQLPGCLAASVFGQGEAMARCVDEVKFIAGRIICNGVTTGVQVVPAMVHGGPFPATNQPQTTAVGARAIERWCRSVCVQNGPDSLVSAITF